MKRKMTNQHVRLRAVPALVPAPGAEKKPMPPAVPENQPTAKPAAEASGQTEVQGWESSGVPAFELYAPPKKVRPPYQLTGVVRVRKEAEIAIRNLRRDTGLSMGEIASELILQAAAVCTIRREVGPMG